jgi:hypothetical protein
LLFLDNFIAFFFPRLINLIYTLLQTGFFFFFLRNVSTPYKSILSMILFISWFVYRGWGSSQLPKIFLHTHYSNVCTITQYEYIYFLRWWQFFFSSIIHTFEHSFDSFFWPVCIFLVKYLLRSRINNRKFRVCHQAEGITHQKKSIRKYHFNV